MTFDDGSAQMVPSSDQTSTNRLPQLSWRLPSIRKIFESKNQGTSHFENETIFWNW